MKKLEGFIKKAELDKIIEDFQAAKVKKSEKTPQKYHLLATYQTFELGGVVKLIKKVIENDKYVQNYQSL